MAGQPLATLFGHKPPVPSSPDLTRIIALPRRPPVEPGTAVAEALVEHVTATYSRGPRVCRCAAIQRQAKIASKPCITKLNYAQAWAMHECTLAGGLIGSLATGIGKSLLDIMAPLAIPGCLRAVLMVPPTLVPQLAVEYDLIAEHFRVPSITYHAGAKSPPPRAVPGAPVLHVIPYSRFQRKEATVLLETMKPDLLILDEAHKLKNGDSTSGSRFLRYYAESEGKVRLCAWSGTLTGDELQDYAPFCAIALGEGSPVPLDPTVVDDWGLCLNPDDWQAEAGALEALCEGEESVEDGFSRRLSETLGFVSTSCASIDTPLEMKERIAPALPAVIDGYLTELRNHWVRPDGEELMEAIAVKRCARELACGLYLKWHFKNGETESLVDEWKLARKYFRSEVRDKLKRREPYLDSPMLCALAAARAWGYTGPVSEFDEDGKLHTAEVGENTPMWRSEHWPRWAAVKDKVRPYTKVVRVDPFLAEDAAAWAQQDRGIVWYATVGFGTWVAELSGLPMHGGGPDAGARLAAEDGSRSIVASIASHGTGRDGLQRLFATQLISQFPGSATATEQLLGRLSRIGQEAELVSAWLYRHTPETRDSFDTAMRKAWYVQKTMRQPQKLIAGWADAE